MDIKRDSNGSLVHIQNPLMYFAHQAVQVLDPAGINSGNLLFIKEMVLDRSEYFEQTGQFASWQPGTVILILRRALEGDRGYGPADQRTQRLATSGAPVHLLSRMAALAATLWTN